MLIYNWFCSTKQVGLFLFQDPATPVMEAVIDFHAYVMCYLVAVSVFVLVATALVIYEFGYLSQVYSTEQRTYQLRTSRVVHFPSLEFYWTVLPVIILVLIAIPSFALLYAMDEKTDPALTIKAIGHQWYWSYEYSLECSTDSSLSRGLIYDSYMIPDADLVSGDFRLLEVDNPVVLPVNTSIRLLVTSADVIHSWALPAAGAKMDAIPGRLNQVNLYFNRSGRFYGQCSELCGVNHGFMPICVNVVPLDLFLKFYSAKLA